MHFSFVTAPKILVIDVTGTNAMSDSKLWLGYLEAGEKSSPVVMDTRLNTANPNTIYLFNYNRGEIIEYRRDIIEPKLRPLDGEGQSEKELKSAFTKVRSDFTPRGGKVTAIPEKVSVKQTEKKIPPIASNDEDDEEEIDDFIGDDMDAAWEEG